jgi:hypothetical protein
MKVFSGFPWSEIRKLEERAGSLPKEFVLFLLIGLSDTKISEKKKSKKGKKKPEWSAICDAPGHGLYGPEDMKVTKFASTAEYNDNEPEDDESDFPEEDTRALSISGEGCQYQYILVLEGEMRGAVLYFRDGEYNYISSSFLKWMEDWVDQELAHLNQ